MAARCLLPDLISNRSPMASATSQGFAAGCRIDVPVEVGAVGYPEFGCEPDFHVGAQVVLLLLSELLVAPSACALPVDQFVQGVAEHPGESLATVWFLFEPANKAREDGSRRRGLFPGRAPVGGHRRLRVVSEALQRRALGPPSIWSFCVAWSLVGSQRGSTGTLVVLTTRGSALLGSPTGTSAGYQRLSLSQVAQLPRQRRGPTLGLGRLPTRGLHAPRTSAPSTPPAAGRPKSRRHARRFGRSCRPRTPRWWRVGSGARGSRARNTVHEHRDPALPQY